MRKRFEINPREYSSFDELAEKLFWQDRYIIDDGQYIMDYSDGVMYEQQYPFFQTVHDLYNRGEEFEMIQVDDDIREEILEAIDY